MFLYLDKKLITSSLIPKSIINGLETENKEENLGEASMCAIALLIVHTALGAIKVLKQGNFLNALMLTQVMGDVRVVP